MVPLTGVATATRVRTCPLNSARICWFLQIAASDALLFSQVCLELHRDKPVKLSS